MERAALHREFIDSMRESQQEKDKDEFNELYEGDNHEVAAEEKKTYVILTDDFLSDPRVVGILLLLAFLFFGFFGFVGFSIIAFALREAAVRKKYLRILGTSHTMRIDEIAKRMNHSVTRTNKGLKRLIKSGALGNDAYIDHENGCLVRPVTVIEERTEDAEGSYSAILHNLRTANDRIPDIELSKQIDRLEQISALIFKEVDAHPEKRDSIRRFFDYYLPTTQKLLDAYAEFEELGVDGESISQAKARIDQMMDSIVEGFEHQLDQLFKFDAMDVISDIKVMETLLNCDTASAAKDFGYDTAKTAKTTDEGETSVTAL